MYSLIPALVAAVLLALGLSYLLHARRWLRLFRWLAEQPERLFGPGLAMVAAGVVVGRGYDNWHGTWPIFVTVLGWLLAVEGLSLLLAPGLFARFVSLPDRFLLAYTRIGGALLAVLGVLLGKTYL